MNREDKLPVKGRASFKEENTRKQHCIASTYYSHCSRDECIHRYTISLGDITYYYQPKYRQAISNKNSWVKNHKICRLDA